jgi:hypothetical protein
MDRLAERLLRGGVGLRHVRRTLRELRDHREDLLQRLMDQGLDEAAATREAQQQLGDQDTLVAQMIARPELRSRARRFAWLLFVVGPLPLVCVLGLLSIGIVAGVAQIPHGFSSPHVPSPIELTVSRALLQWLVPMAVSLLLCRMAQRRWLSPAWPIRGRALIAPTSSGVSYHVVRSATGKPMTWLALGPYPFNATRLVALFALLCLMYVLLRRERMAAGETR